MKNIADDVWFEIFLRLPLTAILYKLNYSSIPWALFDFSVDRSPNTNRLKRHFTIAYPDSHSQFINDHQNGFSFNFLNSDCPNSSNDEERKDIYLNSASNGLVLCSISFLKHFNFYVCNPLTQKWVLLPPPPTQMIGVISLICNETLWSSLTSASYKVIHIPRFQAAAKEFKFEVFCSDLGEWNTYDVSCPPDVTFDINMFDNRLTYNGGFYWFQKGNNKILAFSVNGNTKLGTCGVECKLINLPHLVTGVGPNRMRQCIGESEGSICYAIVKEGSLSVWVLDEDWYLLHKCNGFSETLAQRLIGGATTADLVEQQWLITNIKILGFDPFDKNVVILRHKKNVWAYNTRTGAYEQLCHPSFSGSNLPSFSELCFSTFSFKPRPVVIPPVSWRDT